MCELYVLTVLVYLVLYLFAVLEKVSMMCYNIFTFYSYKELIL